MSSSSEPRAAIPAPFITHEVTNQAPPLSGTNLFRSDRALHEAVMREGAGAYATMLADQGAELGSLEVMEHGRLANLHPPVLRSFDRFGHRLDEVEFHPSYHAMMALAMRHGIHSAPWAEPRPGAHVARAAGAFMHVQAEPGTQCPITMTYGAVPALAAAPAIAATWLPKIYARQYDPVLRPVADKRAVTIGMGMTEKQGGSDVRANTTRAEPLADGSYRIIGHKWFFSAPMCDAFLILAYAPEGLSCFFLPRILPDGTKNALRFQRLKEKLGNRANASSEVEFFGAIAWPVGQPGRGVPTIIEMANHTRLDCALGNAGLMRQAVAQAIHHAQHRTAFQRHLADQPLMSNVLADLALESEAATALVMRLAASFDRQDDAAERAFRRLATPLVKFWICKRASPLAAEAMEVLGGNGYVEEGVMARIYREAPLNSIWEGSGNIMCLDLLRAIAREPAGLAPLMDEISLARGGHKAFDGLCDRIGSRITDVADEYAARHAAAQLALGLQASLLLRHAPSAVADAFCAARLTGDAGLCFGTLPRGHDTAAIVARASPHAA